MNRYQPRIKGLAAQQEGREGDKGWEEGEGEGEGKTGRWREMDSDGERRREIKADGRLESASWSQKKSQETKKKTNSLQTAKDLSKEN